MPSNDAWHVHVHILGLRLNFAWRRPWGRSQFARPELTRAA
ncbi:hypothetical protein [Mycolicibacterium sp. 050158]|nr:hypothetical protein [Mycolicibacterium sp. 050158]MDX1890265.1 hypothetical protein [Mycolicibacterium sp. 050158]